MAKKKNHNNIHDLNKRIIAVYEVSRQFNRLDDPSSDDFQMIHEALTGLPYRNKKCQTLIFETYLFVLDSLDKIATENPEQDKENQANKDDAEIIAEIEPVIRHDAYKAIIYIAKQTAKNAAKLPENLDVIINYLEIFISDESDKEAFKDYCAEKKIEPYVCEMLYLDLIKHDPTTNQLPEMTKGQAIWLLENSLYIDTRVALTDYLLTYGAQWHQLDPALPIDLVDIALNGIEETLAYNSKDKKKLTKAQMNTTKKFYAYFRQNFDAILAPEKQNKPNDQEVYITNIKPSYPEEIANKLAAQKAIFFKENNKQIAIKDYPDYNLIPNYKPQNPISYKEITDTIPLKSDSELPPEEIAKITNNRQQFRLN